MNRSIFSFAILVLSSSHVPAQTVTPATLNALGHGVTIGSNEFEWSVGEMTLVSTFITPGIIVTQGILQPFYSPVGVSGPSMQPDKLQVFPNPAATEVNVQYTAMGDGALTCTLVDVTGNLISEQTFEVTKGINTEKIDVAALANAIYLLRVTFNSGISAETATFKIQKLK